VEVVSRRSRPPFVTLPGGGQAAPEVGAGGGGGQAAAPPPTRGVIRWEDPPPSKEGYVQQMVAALQSWPGHWALVYEDLPDTTAYDRARYLRRLGAEVNVRRTRSGSSEHHPHRNIWACWPEEGTDDGKEQEGEEA